ncbi:hypothetical protein QFZ99_006210 [Paraburkholderia atlantica]|uniref:Uncharacterized protein n=1 Tax=Paraburkholderia atlantica TaxID=2654982 RepID=A0A7W8V7E0_PARAM|nr:hypothetical protein [Paraburkholderia atlantica]MBB5425620.1 hypothetical protein [Paraburkholderia atlantica]
MGTTLHAKIRRHILIRTRFELAAATRFDEQWCWLSCFLSVLALPQMASLKPRAARAIITVGRSLIGKNVLALFPRHVGWNRTQKRTNLPRFFGPNSPSGENFIVRRAMHFSKREARRIPIHAGFGDARIALEKGRVPHCSLTCVAQGKTEKACLSQSAGSW